MKHFLSQVQLNKRIQGAGRSADAPQTSGIRPGQDLDEVRTLATPKEEHRMQVLTYVVGPMENNTYVITPSEDDPAVVVVDPGFGAESLLEQLRHGGRHVTQVLLTHAHLDHFATASLFVEAFDCSVALHPADADLLNAAAAQAQWFGVPPPPTLGVRLWLQEGMHINVGEEHLKVIQTPGHSPGHVCFIGNGWIIVGDLVFAGSIGRSDLPGGNAAMLMKSIRTRILSCDDATVLYPGHGPATTVGQEKRHNPFLVEGVGNLWR